MLRADFVVPGPGDPEGSERTPSLGRADSEHASAASASMPPVYVSIPLVQAGVHAPHSTRADEWIPLQPHEINAVLSFFKLQNEKAFTFLENNTRRLEVSDGDEQAGSFGHGECTVCLDAMVEGQLVTKSPCGHSFHQECLSRWMATKLARRHTAICPNCNHKIVEPHLPTESQDDAHLGALCPRFVWAVACFTLLLLIGVASFIFLSARGGESEVPLPSPEPART